jgi:PKHD-type hydroxylase
VSSNDLPEHEGRIRQFSSDLLMVPDCVEPALCEQLCAVAGDQDHPKATVIRPTGEALDEQHRRTQRVQLDAQLAAEVWERVADLRKPIARHFQVRLAAMQEPQLLRYRQGDFFRAHQDSASSSDFDDGITRRRVSVVVFLNDQAAVPAAGSFCGGELRFFMLDRNADARTARTVVPARRGLAVAFSSDRFHEVAPVTAGVRYSVVGWFLGPA